MICMQSVDFSAKNIEIKKRFSISCNMMWNWFWIGVLDYKNCLKEIKNLKHHKSCADSDSPMVNFNLNLCMWRHVHTDMMTIFTVDFQLGYLYYEVFKSSIQCWWREPSPEKRYKILLLYYLGHFLNEFFFSVDCTENLDAWIRWNDYMWKS